MNSIFCQTLLTVGLLSGKLSFHHMSLCCHCWYVKAKTPSALIVIGVVTPHFLWHWNNKIPCPCRKTYFKNPTDFVCEGWGQLYVYSSLSALKGVCQNILERCQAEFWEQRGPALSAGTWSLSRPSPQDVDGREITQWQTLGFSFSL